MRRVCLLFLGLLFLLIGEITHATDCPLGYKIVGRKNKTCVDIDECTETPGLCGKNAVCNNTGGSYFCTCEDGFISKPKEMETFTAIDKVKCKDLNECLNEAGLCGDNAECTNTESSYFCTCKEGFAPSNGGETFKADQGVTCKDRDECKMAECEKNAVCKNTAGDYYCTCNPGYKHTSGKSKFTKGEGVCERAADECTDKPGICGSNAVCNNTGGSYFCTCEEGFISKPKEMETFTATDKVECKDVCEINKSLCGEGQCKKVNNSHECLCNLGFTNYGFKTMKCSKPNYEILMDTSTEQISTELEQITEKLKSIYLNASQSFNRAKMQTDPSILLEKLLNAIDELLSAGPLNNNRKVTSLLEITERVLKLLGPLLSNTSRSSVHTQIQMLVRRDDTPTEGRLILATDGVQFDSHWETAAGASYLGFAAAALLRYNSLKSSVNAYFDDVEKHGKEKFKINSDVVTAVVTNSDTAVLEKPIKLTFSHLEQPLDGNQTCVFWNSTLNGGAWSTNGCTVVMSNANQTVCSCTHLSSFAVLMALYEKEDVFELKLITWIGLSLSLICLFISILTFRFIRSIQSTRTTIHLHLCISLFIANLVFLAGITQTENRVGCAFVAGLLHFFFLAAFCWMCLEGVQLFRMVVLVFNTTLRSLYLMAGGYGIPALIVAISAIANAKGYGTERHCWLDLQNGFIWSFFGPVCLIIVVNIFFFLITVWKLAQKFSTLNQDLSKLHKIKSFTITAIAQLCVLGTMWIFGCFQFEEQSLAVDYIFTILNSLQGVLVFVMHCLFSKQVRDEYARILTGVCAPQKRKYSEFSTNQTSKSQGSGSVHNTGESHI
ncbi:CD97 antigen-like isoform X1 [Astyanax mexicanus]|uniref:CD97 antigen-like isoform X1 n=1 Tax=Astyanax mexicanus TaxID=7994 RepID=A0A8T2M798_ASTMX|nr:CD97 antigen-like isoform X1 [Astyanax mexicanus]